MFGKIQRDIRMFSNVWQDTTRKTHLHLLREVFKKLRREKLRPKNTTGGGGGGQRCQKDTTVPTKSDFISNYIGPF